MSPLEEDRNEKKPARPEKDLSIDLTADDAIDRLDRVHSELGSPPEAGDDPVTTEDEREDAEHDAEMDRQWDEINMEDIGFWLGKVSREGGGELDVMRRAGYAEKDVRRVAEKIVADILKEEERLIALRRASGLREKKPSTAEDIMDEVLFHAERVRRGRPRERQETADLDLIKKPETEDEDDTKA